MGMVKIISLATISTVLAGGGHGGKHGYGQQIEVEHVIHDQPKYTHSQSTVKHTTMRKRVHHFPLVHKHVTNHVLQPHILNTKVVHKMTQNHEQYEENAPIEKYGHVQYIDHSSESSSGGAYGGGGGGGGYGSDDSGYGNGGFGGGDDGGLEGPGNGGPPGPGDGGMGGGDDGGIGGGGGEEYGGYGGGEVSSTPLGEIGGGGFPQGPLGGGGGLQSGGGYQQQQYQQQPQFLGGGPGLGSP